MSKAKINRSQKAFLKAMKERFAEDPTGNTRPESAPGISIEPEVYKVIDCPICKGRRYHGPKRTFCHSCGGTGQKRVRA